MSVKSYIESNKDRFLEELFSLIRIPSISAKQEHQPDMLACAQRWVELLCASGANLSQKTEKKKGDAICLVHLKIVY